MSSIDILGGNPKLKLIFKAVPDMENIPDFMLTSSPSYYLPRIQFFFNRLYVYVWYTWYIKISVKQFEISSTFFGNNTKIPEISDRSPAGKLLYLLETFCSKAESRPAQSYTTEEWGRLSICPGWEKCQIQNGFLSPGGPSLSVLRLVFSMLSGTGIRCEAGRRVTLAVEEQAEFHAC